MTKFINSMPERVVAITSCNVELGDLFTLVHHVQNVAGKMYYSRKDLEQVYKPLLQLANRREISREGFVHLQEYFPWATKVFAEAYYLEYLTFEVDRTDSQKIKLFNAACFEGNVEFFPLLSHVNKQLKEMLDD